MNLDRRHCGPPQGGVQASTSGTLQRIKRPAMNHIRFIGLKNFPDRLLGALQPRGALWRPRDHRAERAADPSRMAAGSTASGRVRPSSWLRRNGIGAAPGSPIIVDLACAQPALSRMLRGGSNKVRCGSPAMTLINSTTCGAFGAARFRQRVSGQYHQSPHLSGGSPMHRDPAALRTPQMHRAPMRPTVRLSAF